MLWLRKKKAYEAFPTSSPMVSQFCTNLIGAGNLTMTTEQKAPKIQFLDGKGERMQWLLIAAIFGAYVDGGAMVVGIAAEG